MTDSMHTASTPASASPNHSVAIEGSGHYPVAAEGGRLENVDKALRRTMKVRTSSEPGVWHAGIPGLRYVARVELDDDWLTISVPLRSLRKAVSHESIGTMLRHNDRLHGCPRIVGEQLRLQRHLVADIPAAVLDQASGADIDSFLAATFHCLGSALGGTAGTPEFDTPEPTPAGSFEDTLGQAGWSTLFADEGGIEVPLEVPGDYAAARIEQDCGSARLHLPVLEHELATASVDARRAVTLLLWLTASRVRMVKPLRRRQLLALDVALHPMPASAIALGHACAALSTALQRFMGEARMLISDERLAQTYLSNLGFLEAE